ncbi:hypothetical protein GCM10027348_05150 [Hymenobacter tenuis]
MAGLSKITDSAQLLFFLPMKPKIREWLRRYLPAEGLSVVATLAGASVAWHLAPGHELKAALAGTWAGNVAYFGWLLGQDLVQARRELHALGRPYTRRTFAFNVRALAVEFGPAEVLDSLLIRPALMYWLPRLMGSRAGGILVAKLLADVTFYVPAIISYELSKKRLRNFGGE